MLSRVKFIPRDQVDEARGEDGSNSSKRRKKDGKREKRGRKSSRSKSSSDDGLERIKEGSRRKKKWYSSDEYSSSSSSENEDRIGKSRKRKGVKESRKVDHSPDGGKESNSINEIEVTRKEMGLDWMLRPADTSDKKAAPKVDAQPKEPAEEVKRVNPRELNPYLKDDGSGYPDEAEEKRGREQLPKSSVVGDGGASWRLKALKRAEEQAARDGRKLDEVVEERWGSLGQLAVSTASHRAAPSRAHLHAIRSRQMRQKEEQRPATDGQRKQDIEKTPDRSYLKDVSVRHPEMRAPKVRDSLSWGKQKTPKVSANDAIIISSAASSLNKFANDGNFMNQVLGQTNDLGSSNAKLEVVSRADSSEMIQPVEGTVVIKEGMTANQLAAKALQLRLKGNHEEADKLRRPEISPAMLSLRSTLLSRAIRKKKKKKKTHQSKRRNKPRRTPAISKREQTPAEDDEEEGFNLKGSAPSHSYGVQPLGNLYFNLGAVNSRNPGLGNLQFLSDELVLDILGLLSASHLGNLAAVSKSFYVFTNHEPLWRNLMLDELKGGFFFNGSWRSTYVATRYDVSSNLGFVKIRVKDFYSDYLFQSWLCANLEMKPEWLERDKIVRKRGISVDEFVSNFEEPNKSVLLEGCIDDWPGLEKWVDRDYLIKECGDVRFSVGPVKMKLDEYFRYSDQVKEERPLYLFDPKFAEKVPVLDSDYEVPAYFREDLFNVLGSERPDYRWIIMGPAGSGSSFHIDPNSTSAWNAVIKGSKKWILFPPDVVPPGVHPSPDGADVACPVSIIEWFMNFYSATKKWKKRPVECVCKAVEVIFVPNGWWHLVINLEESIAITQNYVSRRNLLNVLDFLKRPNASELVSGTRDRVNLHDKFKTAVEAHLPQGTIDQLVEKAEETKKAQQKKVSFWESLTDAEAGGFKFSF